MTKLYNNGQREGWQVPGQQDKGAERIDVPSAPADLAAWLNHRRVGPTGLAARFDEIAGDDEQEPDPQLSSATSGPRVPGFCDSCGRSAAGTLKLAQGNDLETIGQWMETAELWAIKALVDRARDVVRGRGEALDGKGVQ
jgi:hypothetical protein